MIALFAVLILAGIVVAGYGFLRLLKVFSAGPAAVPLSLCAAIGALGSVATVGVLIEPDAAWIRAALAILGAGFLVAIVRLRAVRLTTLGNRHEVAILSAAVVLAVFLLYAARHEALLSDGWSVWQVKAHALRTDGFEAVYRDNTLHRRLNSWGYPLAWPALHAIVGYLLGRPTWEAASLTGVFCFLAIGRLLWASLRDRVPAPSPHARGSRQWPHGGSAATRPPDSPTC